MRKDMNWSGEVRSKEVVDCTRPGWSMNMVWTIPEVGVIIERYLMLQYKITVRQDFFIEFAATS